MNPSVINPYLRVATHSVIPAHHRIRRRVIYDYELIYLERGEFTLTYADVPHLCHAGDLILICPGVPHSFAAGEEPFTQPHIHFDLLHRPESARIPISFKDTDEMSAEERGWIHANHLTDYPTAPFVSVRDMERFLTLFYELLSYPLNTDPLTEKGLFLQLFAAIIRDNFADLFERQLAYTVEQQIKDCIDAGDGLCMGRDDFSRRFSYSKFYLEKRFRTRYGMGLIEYRNRRRMVQAKKLLNEMSVSAVAEALGYSSIYSFSRAYKNYYGVAPSKEGKINYKKY